MHTPERANRTGPSTPPELSREEFAALYLRGFRMWWLIAAGILGNRTLADDVVQEAAVIAVQKKGEFVVGTNFNAWMARLVRNVARNTYRKEARRRGGDPGVGARAAEPGASAPLARTPDMAIRGELPPGQQAFDDRLVAALSSVEATARACLLLRTIEGLEYAEISKLLDIPEGTAMSHVHRTRRMLRKRLGGWEEPIRNTGSGRS